MGSKRRCTAKTKAGKPCSNGPLTGRDTCLAHAPKDVQDEHGYDPRAAGKLGGRPRKPRVVDVLRERLEERIDEALAVLWEAMKADKAIVTGQGEDSFVELIPDHPVRLRALQEALDRSYGRPKQQTEVSGPDGGPVPLERGDIDLSKLPAEKLRELRELLADATPDR